MNDTDNAIELKRQLSALVIAIQGLSLEVEAGRQHASTNADFILFVLRDVLAAVTTLQKALQ